jgi:hypothetical protein
MQLGAIGVGASRNYLCEECFFALVEQLGRWEDAPRSSENALQAPMPCMHCLQIRKPRLRSTDLQTGATQYACMECLDTISEAVTVAASVAHRRIRERVKRRKAKAREPN